MEKLSDGCYKMSKIDMIKLVRNTAKKAASELNEVGVPSLQTSKDAVFAYLFEFDMPLLDRDAIYSVAKLLSTCSESEKQIIRQKLGL